MREHIPVLFKESLELLNLRPGAFVIDGTLDGGGHASAIIERIMPGGTFLGVDLDPAAVRQTGERLTKEFGGSGTLIFRHANFADLAALLEQEKLGPADGLLLDLGFSSAQLAGSGKGLAFTADEPLLMTYDPAATPVKQLIKELSETELANAIYQLSGERFSRRIAHAIKARLHEGGSIATTGELASVVRSALPRGYERGRIDPATRTFQALRILANRELENLERVLADLPRILKPGGRAAIISFHSLEDGMVKRAFQSMAKSGAGRLLSKKPVTAAREEQLSNPRSRSAKLRGIEIAS